MNPERGPGFEPPIERPEEKPDTKKPKGRPKKLGPLLRAGVLSALTAAGAFDKAEGFEIPFPPRTLHKPEPEPIPDIDRTFIPIPLERVPERDTSMLPQEKGGEPPARPARQETAEKKPTPPAVPKRAARARSKDDNIEKAPEEIARAGSIRGMIKAEAKPDATRAE